MHILLFIKYNNYIIDNQLNIIGWDYLDEGSPNGDPQIGENKQFNT